MVRWSKSLGAFTLRATKKMTTAEGKTALKQSQKDLQPFIAYSGFVVSVDRTLQH